MNTVLKIFLSMSFSGGLLIAVLLLGKGFLKDKISRQWQYYIWLVVILRLLLPFGPETNLLGNTYQALNQAMTQAASLPQQQSLSNAPGDTLASADNPELANQKSAGLEPSNQKSANLEPNNQKSAGSELDNQKSADSEPGIQKSVGSEPTDPANDLTAAHPLHDILALLKNHIWMLWLIGTLVMLIRKATIYQGFMRYLKAGLTPVSDLEILDRLCATAEQAGVQKPIELCVNPLISSPLLIGFFHPCIVLPGTDIPEKDFQYILLHELTHYKRRDMFYKLLVQVTVCLHWFNPLVHLMSREITKACEFSCDEAVLTKMGCDNAQDYGKTLLDAMAAVGRYRENLGAATLNENKQVLKERLDAIMKFQKPSKAVRILTGALTLCVVFGAAFIGIYSVVAADTVNPMPPVESSLSRFIHVTSAKSALNSANPEESPLSRFIHVTSAETVLDSANLVKSLLSRFDNSTSTETVLNSTNPENPSSSQPDGSASMETLNLKGTTYYLVQNEAQLRAIGTGEYGMDQNYMQQSDIRLSEDEWIPIGTWDNPFTGTFNGNGFEIIGLTMTDPDAKIIGLFGIAENAHIYNVTMRDYDILDAGTNVQGKSVGAILAIGRGVRSSDNFAHPKEAGEDIPDQLSGDILSKIEQYYAAESLPLFEIAFSRLDESAQKTWLEKLYADDDIAFFSVALRGLGEHSPLPADFAEKAYADGKISFFSILADWMDETELELWLDRALEDGKWNFQSVLFDRLGRDDEFDELENKREKEWAEAQKAEYQAVGVTIEGKNYYYQSQLVNIFLDIRANQAFYTLNMNPAGTVNIKIIRDADNKITGVAYMTEAEVTELLGDLSGPDDE